MQEDFITKYRPKYLEDFWTQDGPVAELAKFLLKKMLPLGLILGGPYGSGKTSLGMFAGQYVSCQNPSGLKPCYSCTGCDCVDHRINTHGARFVLHGGRFNVEALEAFSVECNEHLPPEPYNCAVAIIDEAQLLTASQQGQILHLIESTKNTRFIFCTTNPSEIDPAIAARCQKLNMVLPSEQQVVSALQMIAQKEEHHLPREIATQIAQSKQYNPRECLLGLQYFIATGNPPSNGRIGENEVGRYLR